MATRLYLPSSGTAPLASLAYDSNWEQSTGLVRLPCSITKSDTALTNSVRTWASATTQQWVWWQFQSAMLAEGYSWTTSDTVSLVIRGLEANTACDSHVVYSVRVVSADGSTVRGTVGLYHAISTEFTTSALTRIHNARTTGATNFTSYAGDRIIIELGLHGVTPSTSYTNTMRIGDPTATSDFALTAGLTTDLCPWVQLSRDVIFGNARMTATITTGGANTVSGTLQGLGIGHLSASIGGGISISDDFESYNTGALDGQGNWVALDAYDYVSVVDSSGDNRVTGGGTYGARRTEIIPNDQYAQLTIDYAGPSGIGVGVRCSGQGATWYGFYYFAGSDDGYVGYLDGGILQNIAGTGAARAYNGDVLRLEIEGNTLRCYRNGSLDTTLGGTGIYDVSSYISLIPALASGSVGIVGIYADMQGDDFVGGSLASSCGATVSGTLSEAATGGAIAGATDGVAAVSGTLQEQATSSPIKGLVGYGSDTVLNGGFDSSSDWTLVQDCTITGGVLSINCATTAEVAYQEWTGIQYRYYRIAFDLVCTSGTLRICLGSTGNSTIHTTSGHKEYILYTEYNPEYNIQIRADSGFVGTIDNFEVQLQSNTISTVSGILSQASGATTPIGSSGGVSAVSGTMLAKALISGSSAGGPTGGLYDLLTGLTAHWSFDETSGAYTDGAGSNDSVNIGSGVTRGQTGRIGNAAQFNGTANAFVLLPDSSDLQFGSSDVTFGCWFYTDGDYGQSGLFGGEPGSFAIDTYSGRHLFLGNTMNAAYEFGNLTYNLNSWNFAVIVFNSALTTNNATLYLNGSSQTITANFNGTAGAATRIIGMDYLYGLPFTGLIDSPFIYKGRLLTAAEIAYLYNSGNGRPLSEFASGGVRGTLTEGVPATTLIGSSAGIASVAGDLSGPTNIEEIFAIVSTGSSVSGTMLAKARIYGVIGADQIIANHTVVDKYSDIPQQYIDEVKKMWLSYAGESHSEAIRTGLLALETAESKYAVVSTDYPPPQAYTDVNLRANRATWGDLNSASGWIYSYGEEDWYKSQTAINRTKAGLDYYHNTGPAMAAFGFGWCWDPAEDATDMAVYNSATQEYEDHCRTNGYLTKVFFTTGPVDGENASGVTGYTKYLAYEAIRNYASQNKNRILFDYADILCYDNDGSGPNTAEYNGHIYPIITTANVSPEQTGHISNVGALRLAKAMWWMLARMEGWQGESLQVSVTGTLTEKAITEGLSGLSTGVSSVSGTLRATGQIYTLSNGVALVGAILNGNGLLQGAISTNGTVSGLLLGLGRLAVSVNAIASVVGRLSSSGVFAGHIGGVASVSGSLSATVNISASINAAANVTGALKGSIIATSSGVSTVTGRILATANLVITSSGVSLVSGTLKADGRLTTHITSTTSLTGILRAKGRLVTLINTQALVSADLNGRGRLTGISQGVATCSLIPVLITQAGIINGVALVSGTLRAKGSLSASINSYPIVSAHINGWFRLSTVITCSTNVLGLLLGKSHLSGTIAGVNSVSGLLLAKANLAGVITNINTSSAILRGNGRLIAQINIAAILNATLLGEGRLTGLSEGIPLVWGAMREYIPPSALIGSILTYSEVSGNLWDAANVYKTFSGSVSMLGVKAQVVNEDTGVKATLDTGDNVKAQIE